MRHAGADVRFPRRRVDELILRDDVDRRHAGAEVDAADDVAVEVVKVRTGAAVAMRHADLARPLRREQMLQPDAVTGVEVAAAALGPDILRIGNEDEEGIALFLSERGDADQQAEQSQTPHRESSRMRTIRLRGPASVSLRT